MKSKSTADKIRVIRKKQGLTQRKLGELSGISEQMIRNYENNISNPKFENLQKIAIALKVHINELFPDSVIQNGEVKPDCMDKRDVAVGKHGRKFVYDAESMNHVFGTFEKEHNISVEEMFETYPKEEIFKTISMFAIGVAIVDMMKLKEELQEI